jgi:uncharacterized membrane protein
LTRSDAASVVRWLKPRRKARRGSLRRQFSRRLAEAPMLLMLFSILFLMVFKPFS